MSFFLSLLLPTSSWCSVLLSSLPSQIIVKLLREVDLLVRLVGNDCFLTRLPVSRADGAILVSELEGLDESNGLVDGATDGVVVDLHGAKLALTIDDENATESGTVHRVRWVLDEHVVVAGHVFTDVCEQGIVNRSKAALGTGCVHPG